VLGGIVDVEVVNRVAGGVIRRDVELDEVVLVVFELWPGGDAEAHAREDIDELIADARDHVLATDALAMDKARLGDVNLGAFSDALRAAARGRELGLESFFECRGDGVDALAVGGALVFGDVFHRAHGEFDLAFGADVRRAPRFQGLRIAGAGELGGRIVFKGVKRFEHGPKVIPA